MYITADFSSDYVGMSTYLNFTKCSSKKCLIIPITDDMVVEQTESFFVNLRRPGDLDYRIMLHSGYTEWEVTIRDDDSK